MILWSGITSNLGSLPIFLSFEESFPQTLQKIIITYFLISSQLSQSVSSKQFSPFFENKPENRIHYTTRAHYHSYHTHDMELRLISTTKTYSVHFIYLSISHITIHIAIRLGRMSKLDNYT